jgi:hypothetical protein
LLALQAREKSREIATVDGGNVVRDLGFDLPAGWEFEERTAGPVSESAGGYELFLFLFSVRFLRLLGALASAI